VGFFPIFLVEVIFNRNVSQIPAKEWWFRLGGLSVLSTTSVFCQMDVKRALLLGWWAFPFWST